MSDVDRTYLPGGLAALALTVAGSTVGAAAYQGYLDMQEWGPPLTVFGLAIGGGLAIAQTLRSEEGEVREMEAAAHREDLLARHDEALEALAALETQKAQMAPEDYEAERRSLLALGATALRELDTLRSAPHPDAPASTPGAPVSQSDNALSEGVKKLTEALGRGEIDEVTYAKAVAALSAAQSTSSPSPQAAAPAPAPVSRPAPARPAPSQAALAPQWTGAIYALVGFGLIGTLLYFVSTDAQPRAEGAGMTGNQELSAGERPPASAENAFLEQAKAQAEQRLAADPEDLEALNTLTQLTFQEPQVSFNYNQQALKLDPENADALVYQAVLTTIMGMPDKALEKYDAIIAKHPENEKAHAYKGLSLLNLNRFPEAAEALQKAVDLGVNDPGVLQALTVARSGGMPSAPPPAPAAPPPGASSSIIVSGTVDLDPSRTTFKAQTLFVNVKDPSRPGPPLAALKLPPGPFPMEFRVTEADRIAMGPMGGQPLPANLVLQVRLDDDGNAFTKAPTDPQAKLESVAKGSEGITLTLR